MKINRIQNKGIMLIITAIISVLIASTAVYAAVSSTITSPALKDVGALKDSTTKKPSEINVQNITTGSAITYDEWKTAMEQSGNKLPRDQELALYSQGYDFSDIQEAEYLTGLCEKTPQELLQMKGKTTYSTDSGSIKDSSKPWSDIISELKIKLQTPTHALGVTSAQINDMKQQGLSDADIEQVALLSFNNKKDYTEIVSEIKQGTSLEDLKKKYWQTRQDDAQKQDVPKDKAKANTEKLLKKQYSITDDEIQKCSEQGITNMVEIASAKDIANKNNVGLDQVLQIKKNKNDWKAVRDEAGGK